MSKQIYKRGKAAFIKAVKATGVKGNIEMTILNRPGNSKTEPYTEARLYNEDLYLLAVNHPEFVKNMLTNAGLPVYGVTARALPVNDTDKNAIRLPGVLARFV